MKKQLQNCNPPSIKLLTSGLILCMQFTGLTADQTTSNSSNRRFLAGAAASNITPPLGGSIMGLFNERHSAHIHDELHARCLVLDDGSTRIGIVVCDNCMIPRQILDETKRRIQERSGLPADHILI